MRPSAPFSTQIVIAMSMRLARSAPATRLDTGKFAMVETRTANTAYLSASAERRPAARDSSNNPSTNATSFTSRLRTTPHDLRLETCNLRRLSSVPQRPPQHLADHRLRQLVSKLDLRRHLLVRA